MAVQNFFASTTWLCPADVFQVQVECLGGGGSGGAATGTNSAGAGGNAGWYAIKLVTVVPGTTYTVTVGAPAFGVATGNGTAGNPSWFSTIGTVFAQGGNGGPGASGAGSVGVATSPTNSSIGDTVYQGGSGASGRITAPVGGGGGGGGPWQAIGLFAVNSTPGGATGTYGGSGGIGGTAGAGQNGGSASYYGAGGGAGYAPTATDRSSGSGTGGVIRLTYEPIVLYLFT